MKKIENVLDNAAREYPGPILLLAGPGTGKTYQLALRAKYLINEMDVSPNEIAIMTFTNKAAKNMVKRVSDSEKEEVYIPIEKHPSLICTMHSLGKKIIDTYPNKVGLTEDYRLLVTDDIKKLILRDAALMAGYSENDSKETGDCRTKGKCKKDEKLPKCQICAKYSEILLRNSTIDYDDQIFKACRLLSEFPEIKEEWQKKTKYLLVDEYQDINYAQLDFIKLLSEGQEEGLFVVGDDDQSIYSFRGGSPEYIKNFENDFGNETKIGILSKNFRCTPHFLKGALAIVEKFNTERIQKPEPTFEIESDTKIIFHNEASYSKGAKKIAYITKNKIKDHDVLILVPTRHYMNEIKKALSLSKIKYECKTRISEEGLKIIDLLGKWLENNDDSLKLRFLIEHIIESDGIGIPSSRCKTKEKVEKRHKAHKTIAELWSEVDHKKSLIKVLKEKSEANENNDFFVKIFLAIESIREIISTKGGKKEGLAPFLERIGSFLRPCHNANAFIKEVQDWVNELIGGLGDESKHTVQIMSMQKAKGLEADIVFVVGLTKGQFPKQDDDNIAEKARLFFVSMTRAMKELHLFHSRLKRGDVSHSPNTFQLEPSSFINIIQKEHMKTEYRK